MTEKKQTETGAGELSETDMETVQGGGKPDRSVGDGSGSKSTDDLAKGTKSPGFVIKEWET